MLNTPERSFFPLEIHPSPNGRFAKKIRMRDGPSTLFWPFD